MTTTLTVESMVEAVLRLAKEPACQLGRTQISYDEEEDCLIIMRHNLKPNSWVLSSTTMCMGVYEFGKECDESLFRTHAERLLHWIQKHDPLEYLRIHAEIDAKKKREKSKPKIPRVAIPISQVAVDVAGMIKSQKNKTEFVEKAVRAYFKSVSSADE